MSATIPWEPLQGLFLFSPYKTSMWFYWKSVYISQWFPKKFFISTNFFSLMQNFKSSPFHYYIFFWFWENMFSLSIRAATILKKYFSQNYHLRPISVITSPPLLYSSIEPLPCHTKFLPFLIIFRLSDLFVRSNVAISLTLPGSIH